MVAGAITRQCKAAGAPPVLSPRWIFRHEILFIIVEPVVSESEEVIRPVHAQASTVLWPTSAHCAVARGADGATDRASTALCGGGRMGLAHGAPTERRA